MARYCPNCGEPATEGDTFCSECGTSLGAGGGAGQGDQHDSGWEENDSGWDGQDSGWEENDSGWDDQQGSGWEGQQGSSQERQQGSGWEGQQRDSRRTGRGGGGTGRRGGVPRMGAIDTFTQGLRWLVGVPVLAGAFIAVELLAGLGSTVSGVFSLVGWILGLVLWVVALNYAERLAYGDQVRGDLDELLDTASEAGSHLLSLIGISIIYWVAVVIGLFLLIFPGVYIGARLILAYPACVLDDQGAMDSLSTGWDRGEGNVLKLFGIFVINLAAAFGISILAAVFGGLTALESPVFVLITAPVGAILGGAVQMGVGRVYLETRGGGRQPRGQQQGGYQNTSEW